MSKENLTIDKLLQTKSINYNESKLADFLNVHRSTISKYKDDLSGDKHLVRYRNDKYELLTIASRKK